MCCPKNCKWSSWGSWSNCDAKGCGAGTRTRCRRVVEKASCDGTCEGSGIQTQKCHKCCPSNCKWNKWSSWGSCEFKSGNCGKGVSKRVRSVAVKESCGGYPCDGGSVQQKACSKCCPRDAKWGPWGKWSKCNAGCNKSGFKTRTRKIKVKAACGGRKIQGSKMQKAPCIGSCSCHGHCGCSYKGKGKGKCGKGGKGKSKGKG